MYSKPADLDEAELRDSLLLLWRFDAAVLTYAPVGFGSHHWIATNAHGDGRFVTVDDLGTKRRSADETTDEVFHRLARTFAAVRALREEAGLAFVVSPLVATDGTVLHRLSDRYSVVVHPLIDGRTAGSDGEYDTADDRTAVLQLLVELHRATSAARPAAIRDDGELPNRDELLGALAQLDRPWETGPYGERSRALVATHAEDLERLVETYDQLAIDVLADEGRMVITHGEPHAGNVVIDDGRYLLVDWDTALIAPPERDLWVLENGEESIISTYCDETGVEVVPEALALYRLWYDLAEISGYVTLFRHPHHEAADTAESWRNLVHFLQPRDRWPSLLS